MGNELKGAALAALKLAFRPLASLVLRSGVTWPEVSEACKLVMVDVASRDFGLHGRPTNMSRVAIMTGLGRREVRRLRDLLGQVAAPETERMNGATRVLTGWHLDPEFVQPDGQPRELAYDSGPGASFAELCRRYGGDLAAITLRRELVRVGAMEERPTGQLRVLKRYYMPLQMDPEAVMRGGSMLADVGATVSFNLGKPVGTVSRFAGRASNDRIRPGDLPAFAAYLETEGQAFLERVDGWLSRHEVPPGESCTQCRRAGVGVFALESDRPKDS